MGWEPLTISLERWFADAWTRGLHDAAHDLAWVVATLRHPNLTVSPALRALLDLVAEGAAGAEPPEALPDEVLAAVAADLRGTIERHGRVEEARSRYRARRVRAAGAVSRVRGP